MTGFGNKLAFVVPTKDHPGPLRRMLGSLAGQTYRPDQVVIVDGGDETVEWVTADFTALNIKYLRVYPPSLARQRNAGMGVIDSDITVAGYLDDDLLLEPDALQAIMKFWDSAPTDVGGARLNVVNDPMPGAVRIKSLFFIDSRKRGAVLKSGFGTAIGPITDDKYVDWLSGGATTWRMQVVNEFPFDEWFEGTGYLEDLDYSYRVGKKYRLMAVADARLLHFSSPVRPEMNYVLGKWQVVNRMYFIKKNSELSLGHFCWATVGELMFNVCTAVLKRDRGRLNRAWGNCVGIIMAAQGKIERIGGVYK